MQIISDTTILRKSTKSIDPLYKLLVKNIKSYYSDIDTTLLKKAYDFGMIAHLKQRRYSGEPYFVHCVNVALILCDLKMDPTTIIAGILHDAVEDTGVTLAWRAIQRKERYGTMRTIVGLILLKVILVTREIYLQTGL